MAETPQGAPLTRTCPDASISTGMTFSYPTRRATVASAGCRTSRRRLAELADPAVGEDRDAVGQSERLLGAVRDVHDRGGPVAQRSLEVVEERSASLGVEPGGRLVEQQQAGLERERAREAHPLGLAAGERERLAVGEPRDVEALECRAGGALSARASSPRQRSGSSTLRITLVRAARGAGSRSRCGA